MNASFLLRLSTLAALLGAALSAHAVVFFDDFDVDQSQDALNANGSGFGDFVNDPWSGGGLSGRRNIFSRNLSNGRPDIARSRTSIHGGAFTFSCDQEVSAIGVINYAFPNSDLTGSEDIDVEVLSNDLPGTLTVRAGQAGFGIAETTVVIPAVSTATHILVRNVFAGANIRNANSISFSFQGPNGQDLKIGSVQAVPEPASMVALGLGGLALLRRRKKA